MYVRIFQKNIKVEQERLRPPCLTAVVPGPWSPALDPKVHPWLAWVSGWQTADGGLFSIYTHGSRCLPTPLVGSISLENPVNTSLQSTRLPRRQQASRVASIQTRLLMDGASHPWVGPVVTTILTEGPHQT